MVNSDLYHSSIAELARAGNFQAIAHWINQSLSPYGIRTYVGAIRPGCLKILVELPSLEERELPDQWRDYLVRFICHRIWQLNSAVIEGARIAARYTDESQVLWEQAVRVTSPARRLRQQQSQELRSQVQQTAQRKTQLKTLRSLLISGAPLFAFVVGCVLGFSKAPVEQTSAVASSQKADSSESGGVKPNRPNTVQAALESVPVIKHDKALADPNDPTVTLMFSGDVALGESFANKVGKDFDHAFAAMDEYRKADLAMVNLEEPFTNATIPLQDKQFNFKADPESVKTLAKGGVDLVTLANNHAMDYEQPGLVETMDTLDKAGILHLGAGRDEKEARRPDIVEVKGQRVAYLGYYGADLHAASKNTAGTNYADEARIAADIKSIRDQVDWIVVNFHWGEELATHPADWQVDMAHFTIDQGADVVVGHHPHVLQGAEIYKGRPIAYSLGNFIFGGNSNSDYDTAVLKVALKDKQMKVEFLPVEVRGYQPKVASGEQGTQILKQVEDLSSSFKEPMQSPTVLDARLSPKVEPSPTPSVTPSIPADAATPAPSPSMPADAVAPTPSPVPTGAANPTPSPTAPSDTAPSDTATPLAQPSLPADMTTPSVAPTPSADTAVPAPSPSLSTDTANPAVVPSPAADTGVPATEPAFPADATNPAVAPTTPADAGVPPSDPNLSTQPTDPAVAPPPSADTGVPATDPTLSTEPIDPTIAPTPSADTGVPPSDPNLSTEPIDPSVEPNPSADTGVPATDPTLSTEPTAPSPSGSAAEGEPTAQQPILNDSSSTENNAYTPEAQPSNQDAVSHEAQNSTAGDAMPSQDEFSNSAEASNSERQPYRQEEAEVPRGDSNSGSSVDSVSPSDSTAPPVEFAPPADASTPNPFNPTDTPAAVGGPADPIPATESSPSAMGTADPTSPSPTSANLSGNSFLDSPDRTPIPSTTSTPQTVAPEQNSPANQPSSPETEAFTSLGDRHREQDAERIAFAQLASSSNQTISAQQNAYPDWSASGQVGATLIPNVSLLAAAIW
jgi:poly-gamma-glutamate capsule biosynthesis protein CapA/YwtB (metallophosphatase superfamily)